MVGVATGMVGCGLKGVRWSAVKKGRFKIARVILKPIIQLLFRVKTVNFDKIDPDGRVIIMPNHVSLLDGVFLYLFLPPETVFVVNTEIAKRFSFFMRFASHITIDPLNPYSMKEIIGLIKENIPLVIFPEGRISRTGALMKIYDGVEFLALKTGAAVYPLIINGLEHSIWSGIRDKVRIKWLPRVELYLDEPVQLDSGQGGGQKEKKTDSAEKILEIMQNALFKSRYKDKVNLFNELLQAAALHGWNMPVMEDIKQKVTYKKLILAAYVLGRKLKSVIGREEDCVGILLPNSIAHVATLFSLFYLNKTPAILNFSAGTRNVVDCAETAGFRTVLTSREFVEKGGFSGLVEQLGRQYGIVYLEDIKSAIGPMDKIGGLVSWLRREKPGPARHNRVILFTSGTESKPKGVILKHSNITANIAQVTSVIDLTPKDKIFNALPMFHSFGLTMGTLTPLLTGVSGYLYPTPLHYKIIPELSYEKDATILLGTPGFLSGYGRSAHPFDFYSVRYVFAGAEKLNDEVRMLWQDKFGIRILEGYGCTETSPVLCLNTPLSYRKGSVGKVLPGIAYKIKSVEGIADGGSLLVKGPNVMEGYLIHDRGFIPVGEWYDTGDVVSVDDSGYITIKSRLKRFAKISGEMISLDQVEELAGRCFGPAKGYAAVSVPDSKKGEKVVLVTTDSGCSLREFRDFLNRNHYNMLISPAEIVYMGELPLLGSGKTDYVTLTQLVQENTGVNEL